MGSRPFRIKRRLKILEQYVALANKRCADGINLAPLGFDVVTSPSLSIFLGKREAALRNDALQ